MKALLKNVSRFMRAEASTAIPNKLPPFDICFVVSVFPLSVDRANTTPAFVHAKSIFPFVSTTNSGPCPRPKLINFGSSGVSVIVEAAFTALAATDVAVRVTVVPLAVPGEVYVTATPEALEVGETVPHVAPLQSAPLSVQVTPLFCESF